MTRTLDEVRAATARIFGDAGIGTPALDARLLLCHATGRTHEALIAQGREALAADEAARLQGSVARRLAGEPVSRIKGSREFFGRDFVIGPDTLDPRPDTETLIETALDLLARDGLQDRPLKVLDLGTGSGCILLTLLAELPEAHGIGSDVSEGALQLAAENARRLNLEGRASFVAADWFAGVSGQFDLIVSNPPYIPAGEIPGLALEVAAYDPRAALDGGVDGLAAYRRIAGAAAAFLRPGGHLLVEIGATQAEAVIGFFGASGLIVEGDGLRADLAGRPRCILAKSPLRGVAEGLRSSKISLETPDIRDRFVPAE